MTSSRFIFNELCIKNALINTGEFSLAEHSVWEITTGEFEKWDFPRRNFPRGSSPNTIKYIQTLQKFPQHKTNVGKSALSLLSRAPTHHSFIFNSQLLYKLKHKIRLSEIVCGIFHFWFGLLFCLTKGRLGIFELQNRVMQNESYFELLTWKLLQKFFFWVTNFTSKNIKLLVTNSKF